MFLISLKILVKLYFWVLKIILKWFPKRRLEDILYDEKGKPEPLFFHDVAIRNGELNCEVPENDKMMESSHFQPPTDSEISAAIYDFNRKEEEEAAL